MLSNSSRQSVSTFISRHNFTLPPCLNYISTTIPRNVSRTSCRCNSHTSHLTSHPTTWPFRSSRVQSRLLPGDDEATPITPSRIRPSVDIGRPSLDTYLPASLASPSSPLSQASPNPCAPLSHTEPPTPPILPYKKQPSQLSRFVPWKTKSWWTKENGEASKQMERYTTLENIDEHDEDGVLGTGESRGG